MEFLKTDMCIICIIIVNIVLIILYILNCIKLSKLRKSYSTFMNKIGNGSNLEENLNQYINRVDDVEKTNNEIIEYCKKIDLKMDKCIQKVGIIRYNAFTDTGSDLSFVVALLDNNNDGIVLNGIFSRESSNIYAKPIAKGKSRYRITKEEEQAINSAMNS